MIVDGTVLLLSCPDCGAETPHFRFSGDTDMVTDGLASAGDRQGSRIALFLSSQGEAEEGEDLRPATLVEVIEQGPSAAGVDFATFRGLRRSPQLNCCCPWCDTARMTVSREMTPSEFTGTGGRIDCIGAIELREGQAFS